MHTLHLVSGLPRAGSTLLANILAQNPRFQLAGTSPLVDVLLGVRAQWDRLEEARAMPPAESEATKLRVLRGILYSYHAEGGPVVFDRSRSWLAHLELAEALLGCPVKVLVPIRDVRDILASLEALWRRWAQTRQIPAEARHYLSFQSLPGRLGYWSGQEGMFGIAYARVRDAIARGLRERLFLVSYEELTTRPRATLAAIYEFLGEPPFRHDVQSVQKLIHEDDTAYGMPGLHDFRPRVEANPSRWREILGTDGVPYGALNPFLGYPSD